MSDGCKGKVGYANRREAKASAKSGITLYPYKCKLCGYVHLTRMKQGKFKKLQRKWRKENEQRDG